MEKFWVFLGIACAIAFFTLGFLTWVFKKTIHRIWPRLFAWLLFATLFLGGLIFIHPHQAEVAYYKFALIIGAAVVGYWLDRSIFPYARPDSYLNKDWRITVSYLPDYGNDDEVDHPVKAGYELVFAVAMLRRTVVMLSVILGVTLGL